MAELHGPEREVGDAEEVEDGQVKVLRDELVVRAHKEGDLHEDVPVGQQNRHHLQEVLELDPLGDVRDTLEHGARDDHQQRPHHAPGELVVLQPLQQPNTTNKFITT